MPSSVQVLSVSDKGQHFICILKNDRYTLYTKWYEAGFGWHRRKISDFTDMKSVLVYLADYFSEID